MQESRRPAGRFSALLWTMAGRLGTIRSYCRSDSFEDLTAYRAGADRALGNEVAMGGPDRGRDASELASIFGAAELVSTDSPFPGVTRSSYRSAKATLVSYAFTPDAEFPQHSHAEEQITTVSEGDVEFLVAGASYRLRAGETFVVEAGAVHGLHAGPAGARFLAIVLPPRRHPEAYAVK